MPKKIFYHIGCIQVCIFLRGDDLQVLSTQYWSQLLPKAYLPDCQTSFLNSLFQWFYGIVFGQNQYWEEFVFDKLSSPHRRKSSINRHSVVFLLVLILNRIFLNKIQLVFWHLVAVQICKKSSFCYLCHPTTPACILRSEVISFSDQ